MCRKPDYYYHQSGCIPYRKTVHGILLLLISTRKNKKWTIPKGIIEPGISAATEAMEEAGITGEISAEAIDQYEYSKWQGKCRVKVFSMFVEKVHRQWPEMDFRIRKWFDSNEIGFLSINEKLKKVILNFIEFNSEV